MASTPSTASVPQNNSKSNGKGVCPLCGSPLSVRWAWIGGQGELLVVRCSMERAPDDGTGRWCPFGVELEGHEELFTEVHNV